MLQLDKTIAHRDEKFRAFRHHHVITEAETIGILCFAHDAQENLDDGKSPV